MKYYHDVEANKVYAYDVEDIALAESIRFGNTVPEVFHTIANNLTYMVEVSEEEALAITNPPPTLEELEEKVRYKRSVLLSELDTLVSNPLRWASYSSSHVEALKSYRLALLDITDQEGFPTTVEWPEIPKE